MRGGGGGGVVTWHTYDLAIKPDFLPGDNGYYRRVYTDQ